MIRHHVPDHFPGVKKMMEGWPDHLPDVGKMVDAQSDAQGLPPLMRRVVFDAIRGAYDLGYNDARNVRSVPGDGAPGYQGRDVEADHGGALAHRLTQLMRGQAIATQPAREPMTPEQVRDGIADWIETNHSHREFWTPEVVEMIRAIEIHPEAHHNIRPAGQEGVRNE